MCTANDTGPRVRRRRPPPSHNGGGGGGGERARRSASDESGSPTSRKNDGRGAELEGSCVVGPAPSTGSPPVHSSGVDFYPPSTRYWRLGRKWYDFTDFLPRHPGGSEVLLLLRDRFEDCTFAFESHHLNYKRARKIIAKYEVDESIVENHSSNDVQRRRPGGNRTANGGVVGEPPELLDDNAFYSVIRRRVADHLKESGYPSGEPKMECKVLFWVAFILMISCYAWLLSSASVPSAIAFGLTSAWLGAFGHNWIHQTKYRFWAYLSLDMIGFSSDGWFREHNLQHHMYTNTPWDNHYEGTAPFLVTDPTIERNWIQAYVLPYVNPIILSFGLYGNYMFNLTEMVKGNEKITPWKAVLPLEIGVMAWKWGAWRGLSLMYLSHAILCVYYFTMALMNHNTEKCLDVSKRNSARDWGEAQLHVSADWSVGLPFHRAFIYLWLNYHTVHHLFPLVDMSHHPAIQRILIRTCEEFGTEYSVKSPWEIYRQMVRTFGTPMSLMEEITVYGGGI